MLLRWLSAVVAAAAAVAAAVGARRVGRTAALGSAVLATGRTCGHGDRTAGTLGSAVLTGLRLVGLLGLARRLARVVRRLVGARLVVALAAGLVIRLRTGRVVG